MDNPDYWIWIWLGMAVLFGVGEIASAGSFFLMPLAIGALAAFGASAFGASLLVQWVLFVVISGGAFLALRPLARRLDSDYPDDGIGAARLIGAQGRVLGAIPALGDGLGLIRLGGEEWRAESLDGRQIEVGTLVRVVELRGTRVVVIPTELASGDRTATDQAPTDLDDPTDI